LTYWGVYHFGCKINLAGTKATYQNGILHLEIPVAEMPSETKIVVG
jgi:HSP20 family molecular chaperone IbpA